MTTPAYPLDERAVKAREPQHDVDPQFVGRWSPRAFADATLDDATIGSLFEAARWAPSAFNSQPWRFLWARQGSPEWPLLFDALLPFNQRWVKRASLLIAVVSATEGVPPGKTEKAPLSTHTLDTGAAWGQLAVQAHRLGLATHGMAGFIPEKLRAALEVPAHYAIHAVVAVGLPGDPSLLEDDLRAREVPSPRKPVAAFAAPGRFAFSE